MRFKIAAHRAASSLVTWRWQTLATCHYDLHYPEGLEDLALKAAELAESGYLRVSVTLGHDMDRIIPIVLYPAGNFLRRVCKAKTEDFTRLSPSNELPTAIHVSFNGSYADLRRSLTIETARVFQYAIAADSPRYLPAMTSVRIPFWFSEGIARYCAHGLDRSAFKSIGTMVKGNRYAGLTDFLPLHGCSMDESAALGQAFCF